MKKKRELSHEHKFEKYKQTIQPDNAGRSAKAGNLYDYRHHEMYFVVLACTVKGCKERRYMDLVMK